MDKSILKTVNESVNSLYDAGLVDTITMREFTSMCLQPIKKFSSKEIKNLRLREKLSQPVFAHILNVSPSTVMHWEIGDKNPNRASLKLLNLIFQKGISVLI